MKKTGFCQKKVLVKTRRLRKNPGRNRMVGLEENMPYKLLRLGLACNANCLFCNVPPEAYNLKEMSTQEAKEEIGRLIQSDKGLKMDISGGEPTLRNDLAQLLRYASKKGVKIIQLQTNAILLADKKYVSELKSAGLDKAFVALHSWRPEVHDYLLGRKGSFANCIAGLKNLLAAGIDVALNPVVTSKNYRDLPGYINFIKENIPQVQSISLSVVQPRGRVNKNKYLVPRYSTISPYIKKSLSLAQRNKLMVCNPYCGLPLCIGGWHRYLERCVEYCENTFRLKSGTSRDYVNPDKVKGVQCASCDLKNFCNGVWNEYADIFGFSDLRPLSIKKAR